MSPKDVDARDKPTAVRLSKIGCRRVLRHNRKYPPCPALCRASTSFFAEIGTVSRRGWPGQARPRGGFGLELRANSPTNRSSHRNRTAVGQTRTRELGPMAY